MGNVVYPPAFADTKVMAQAAYPGGIEGVVVLPVIRIDRGPDPDPEPAPPDGAPARRRRRLPR